MRESSATRVVVPGEVCRDFERSSSLEWLETNGTGAFAMGTVSGASTRRYHGLLVASLRPPVERFLMLARVDERVDDSVALGTCQFPGLVHPDGYKRLDEFRLDPFPTWTYSLGGAKGTLEKRVFLVRGEQTVVVRYALRGAAPGARAKLSVDPFVAFRDYHAILRASGREPPLIIARGAAATCVVPGLPPLHLHTNARGYAGHGEWHFDVEYLRELDRGFDFREDLFRAGTFDFDLGADDEAFLVATLDAAREPRGHEDVDELEASERERRLPRKAEGAFP